MRMRGWIDALRQRIRRHRQSRRERTAACLSALSECLESRSLPSSVMFTGTATTPGVLLIDLSSAAATDSTLSVYSQATGGGSGPEVVRVLINGSSTAIHRTASGSIANLPAAMVGRVVIRGGDGADVIDLTGLSAAFGLQQSAAAGVLSAEPSDVELSDLSSACRFGAFVFSANGNDRVLGSAFHDYVSAGGGDDTVFGGLGQDQLTGGTGSDLLIGSLDDDVLEGSAGQDVLVGGHGADELRGGDDDDLLLGGTVNFDVSIYTGLQDVRNRWLGEAANDEVRRQSIAPARTWALGVDDNRDGQLDRNDSNRPLSIGAASTRLVVSQSAAEAFNPATYGTQQPSGTNFLAKLDDETIRIVSRVATSDPDTEVLVIERLSGLREHSPNAPLVAQANSAQSPLRATALWTAPVTADIGQTVFDDFAANTMTGGAGDDWFFVSDELLTYGSSQGDAELNADDVLGDMSAGDARHRAVNVVPDLRRMPVPSASDPIGNVEDIVTAERGTITRLSGDPGTTVLTTHRLGEAGDEPRIWGGVVRTAYVTTPSYNVFSDLIHLGNFPAVGGGANEFGQTRWDFLLSSQQLADATAGITPLTADFPSRNWRWSLNPGEADVEYGFVTGVGPDGQFSGVQKYRFLNSQDADSDTGLTQLYSHEDQTLVFTSFDPLRVGGALFTSKTTLFFDPLTGHNYTLLVGNPRRTDRPAEFDRTKLNAYVVDLDVAALSDSPANAGRWADPVVASFALTAPAGTNGFPYGALPTNIDDFYLSPDGRHILVTYVQDSDAGNGLAWRMLDVNWSTGQITPHVIPTTPTPDEDVPELRTEAARLNGYFPFRWHHAVFAQGASGKSYVVGQPGKWSEDNLVSPNIQYLAGGTTIGQLLRFDPLANNYASLTNPALENFTNGRETLSHVTATNTQNPGYVFASYYSGSDPFTAVSPAYKGAVVAVNIEQPTGADGAIVLAKHRTNMADVYIAQPLVNASSDGTHVLFHSTWGEYQQTVSTYDITLGDRVDLPASGSVVLRRTGASSVALFSSMAATTPIAGSQRTLAAFDTLVVRADAGERLQLSLDFSSGSPVPKGGVLEIQGSADGTDSVSLKNAGASGPWSWFITGDGAGQVRGATSGLIRFNKIGSLTGSESEDDFHISPAARWQGTLSGGAGDDLLNFITFTDGVRASLSDGEVSFANDPSFTGAISQFEHVTGGSGDDQLRGDGGANVLLGGAGADLLEGGGGADTLHGELGDDSLNGQSGADRLFGDEGDDMLHGGGGADSLEGSSGNDSLWGQDDADTLSGSVGDDCLSGGAGIDCLNESGDVNFTLTDTGLLGGLGNDSVSDIEAAKLTGGPSANVLNATGFSGSVTLLAGGGNDELWDAGGDDSLSGDTGDDIFRLLASGTDVVTDGGGTDTLDYSAAVGGLVIDLTRVTRQAVRANHQSTLTAGLERFRGSTFADIVTVNLQGSAFLKLDGDAEDNSDSGDTLRAIDGTNLWELIGPRSGKLRNSTPAATTEFAGFENCIGGSGADAFRLSNGVTWAGSVDGGAGNDVLDWSAFNSARAVALLDRIETGFAGSEPSLTSGFRGIDSIIGSSQADMLTGNNAAATWDVFGERYTETVGGGVLNWDSFENFQGGSDRDSFTNVRGVVPLTIAGGEGNDTLDASQATTAITLLGGAGNDSVRGGSASDRLDGDIGDDTLEGQAGDDTLLGSIGRDSVNGGTGNDLLLETRDSNLTLSNTALWVGELVEDTLVGIERARLAGGESANQIQAGSFTGAVTLIGDAGADTLLAAGGNDSLDGGAGDDLLVGGAGNDTLSGGLGNDVLDDAASGNVLDGGADNDTFRFVGSWNLSTTSLPANVTAIETVFGGGAADTLLGTAAAENFLFADDGTITLPSSPLTFAGFELLSAGGSAAVDSMRGTSGDDTFWLIAPGAVLFNGVKLQGVEAINAGGGYDRLQGSDDIGESFTVSLNKITVAQWTNMAFGGFEVIGGGTGLQADSINGTNANDDFVLGASGQVSVAGFALEGIESLSGGNGTDRLIGSDSSPDQFVVTTAAITVSGWTGRTFQGIEGLLGGGGGWIDTLSGGTSNDTVSVTPSGAISINGLTLTDFELVVGGAGNDKLQGSNTLADVFKLTAAGIAIPGFASTLFDGFETLSGGGGSDTFQVFDGAVFGGTLDGGAGADVVDFSPSASQRAVTLTSSGATGFAGREDVLTGKFTLIESIKGSSADDSLTGLGVASTWDVGGKRYTDSSVTPARVVKWDSFETLIGGSNRDTFNNVSGATSVTLDGGGGNDLLDASGATASVTLLGGNGNDTLKSGRGDDLVNGGEGDDRLFAGVGSDQLLGAGGADSLEGGDGDDVISAGNGNDSLLGGIGNDQLDGGNGIDMLDGGDGDDVMFGGRDNDTLRGGLGDDRLSGYQGSDLLQGHDGNDTLVGGSGADNLDGGAGTDVLAARSGNGTNESDTLLTGAGASDLIIFTPYAIDSIFAELSDSSQPFLWLGSDYEL